MRIQGQEVSLPVEIRRASSWAAQYLVRARPLQRLVDPTGLQVAQAAPGLGMLSLAFVRYEDGDLGPYNEFAVGVMVRAHDARPAGVLDQMREFARTEIRTYIHQLPVNQTFTLEAGRLIWGYPKILADISIFDERGRTTCTVVHEGRHVLSLSVRTGGPLKVPIPSTPTYSFLDGVLRLTPWEVHAEGNGARLGGARLVLGAHDIAAELRSVGLPKRAIMTTTVRRLRATFGEATRVEWPFSVESRS